MKKSGILNAQLAGVIAGLGHGDKLVIGDIGLPVPPGVPCIDLAVTMGVPRFEQVFIAVTEEMHVESALVAKQMEEDERSLVDGLRVAVGSVDHEAFKDVLQDATAIIRTGEATPYANVVLVAGVVF